MSCERCGAPIPEPAESISDPRGRERDLCSGCVSAFRLWWYTPTLLDVS